jgi:hypothetical protein
MLGAQGVREETDMGRIQMTNKQVIGKRLFTNGVIAAVAAAFMLPASGLASTIFTLSSGLPFTSNGSSISGTGAAETATIDFSNLQVNINGSITNFAGSYVETYVNSGAFTLTGTGGISLSITEAPSLIGTFTGNSVSLYSAPTSLTFNSAFLTELSLATNPTLAQVSAPMFAVTASGTGAGSVTSATATMTIAPLTSAPEPSSFAMLGIGLLAAAGFSVRKRIGANRLPAKLDF